MDSFTLAVIVGDAVVVLALVALIVFDKGKSVTPVIEPAKAPAKRSA